VITKVQWSRETSQEKQFDCKLLSYPERMRLCFKRLIIPKIALLDNLPITEICFSILACPSIFVKNWGNIAALRLLH
jgi:hypothetical protein